jgi:hypothetical protein
MRRLRVTLAAAFILSVFTAVDSAGAATLPALEADALSGRHVRLPGDLNGKPVILVIAYDRSASDSLAQWSHKINDNLEGRAVLFAVVDAAGAPFFVHGAIKGGVEKSAPDDHPEHRSNILITFDRRGWDSIAPAGAKDEAAVIVADGSGNVVYARRGAYSDEALEQVLKTIPK